MSEEQEYKLLPPASRMLARRIGLPALRKLSMRWGGVRIYVPSHRQMNRRHNIARCIGYEAAQALSDTEGRRLDVPFCNQAVTALLHSQIIAYRREHSERDTALHFKITDRWVRYLMANAEQPPSPQDDMFQVENER